MKEKILKFESHVDSFELMNEDFVKATINVVHKGKNRNMSDFSDKGMKSVEETILCKPVVCEYLEDKQQIGGHGGKIEITDKEVKWVNTTFEVGFVDPRTKPYYKEYTEKDGYTKNNYLCVDVILWTSRHDFLREQLEKGLGQSFEITVKSGDWREEDDYFVINDANVSALCLLGNGYEPCFSASSVQLGYSLDQRESMYKEMVDTFLKQFTLEDQQGGENVPTDEANIVEETDVVEEFETQEIEVVEEIQEGQAEVVVEEVSHEPQEDSAEEFATDEPEQEVSTDDESVIEGDVDTDKVEEDVVDYELLYQTLSTEHQELQENLLAITTQFEALKVENERLVKFENEVLTERKKVQVDSVLDEFAVLEGFAGFDELKEKAYSLELDELRTKLFALLGQRSFAMIQKETKPEKKQTSAIIVEKQNTPTTRTTEFSVLDKYLPKK